MSQCDLSYFTKSTWTVVDPPTPSGEEKDHEIKIEVIAGNNVRIYCKNGHKPLLGVFWEGLGYIGNLPDDDDKWKITCQKGAKNRIVFDPLNALLPGSWTAEDNGGEGGDGE